MTMKVFLVNSTKTWGGGEKWHLDTACSLRDKGYEVAILAQSGGDLYQRSVSAGIRTVPVSLSNISFINPFCLASLYRLFRDERPDFVLLNFSADIKTAGVGAKWSGIQNIIYRRGSAIPIRNTLINRMLYRKVVTHMIANSEETKRTILQNNRNIFPADRITVIYNGITLKPDDKLPGTPVYKRKNREVLIGNVGRLVKQKGQQYLVDIAILLNQMNIDFTILIGGAGPLEDALKRRVIEAGLEDRIVFLGFINTVRDFMKTIDIFILPSIWEGFGYVLVEAMACEKPVVAFNISSNPEVVHNEVTGFLVDKGDLHAFARKVADLCLDPDQRRLFGKAGRNRAESLFEIEQSQQKVESLLLHLAHKESPAN